MWPPRDSWYLRVRGDIAAIYFHRDRIAILGRVPAYVLISSILGCDRNLFKIKTFAGLSAAGTFLFIFSGAVYVNWWHAGLLIPLLISILWVTWPKSQGQDSSNEMICRVALIVMVYTQILWSAYAMAYDHSHAFSPDLEASEFLKPFVQNGATIAITYLDERQTRSFEGVGIQAYFDRKIYLNQRESFWWWSENNQA